MWLHVPMWVLEEAEDARNATAEGTTAEGRSMDAGPSVMETSRQEGGSRAARARASAPQDAGPSVMKGKTASGAASPCAPGPEDSNWVCLSPYRDIALFVGSSVHNIKNIRMKGFLL